MKRVGRRQETFLVTNPMAIRILADADAAPWLKPFMRQPLSTKAAAKELGVSIQATHYRVQRMLRAGLLEVTDIRNRPGRPIKWYRAVARRFRVPLDLVPAVLIENLERGLSWERLLDRGVRRVRKVWRSPDELIVHLDEFGALNYDWGPQLRELLDPDAPPVLRFRSAALRLDWRDAKALQRELHDLWTHYRSRRGVIRFVFSVGLAPTLRTVRKSVASNATLMTEVPVRTRFRPLNY